jgi:hypothetical protein
MESSIPGQAIAKTSVEIGYEMSSCPSVKETSYHVNLNIVSLHYYHAGFSVVDIADDSFAPKERTPANGNGKAVHH